MFTSLPIFIGWRYTRAKKRNHFVSFISLSSMLGIALGVTVLITVLSVMNGFDEEIHKRFFGMAPEVSVTSNEGAIKNWQLLAKELNTFSEVKASAPYIGGQGMITHKGQVLPVVISGVIPEEEGKITDLKDKLLAGSLSNMKHFGIVLGKGLADNLNLRIGDKITVMIPQASVTPVGMIPRFKRFTVAGVFSAGTGFNFDTRLAFISLSDAQKLFQMKDSVTGMKLRIDKVYEAPQFARMLGGFLGQQYQVGDWTQQFGAFFQAIKLEKTMMFFILILIIAVAAFNLVSSLVMVVNDKQAEIAILRTLGATPKTILGIFIVQGMMVGVLGTLLGLVGGLLLTDNAPALVDWLQSVLGVHVLSSNIYFVDYLPTKILGKDLFNIALVALSMSFLATIYPAWRASKTQIAEALHYE